MGVAKTAMVGGVVLGLGLLAMKMPTNSPGESDRSSEPKATQSRSSAKQPEAKPEKRRPDTPEGRKDFVAIVSKSLPKATIATEGSHNEGLVIDLKDCYETINKLLSEPSFTERLDQFQFKWVRCPSAKLKITPPWR